MDYQSGRIYCIRNIVNDDIYVGSTTQSLSRRMAKHRGSLKAKSKQHYQIYQKMVEHGVDNFYIELIEEYPCNNKEQLAAKEGQYIREMGTLNSRIEGRTKKQYVIDTKEDKQEYDKKYRDENCEKIKLTHDCEVCGGRYQLKSKYKHIQTKMHQTALLIE
jgi:group I intron endonuclease